MNQYEVLPCYQCLTLSVCKSIAKEHDNVLKNSINMISSSYIFVVNTVEKDRCKILTEYLCDHDDTTISSAHCRLRKMQKIYNYLIDGEVEYARF